MISIKNAWKSLTIWFNGLCLAILPLLDYAKDTLPQFQEYVSVETYKIIGLVIIIANILLRFKTTQSLAAK